MPTLSELLVSNPHGWGMNPPAQVYDGDITNALSPMADRIGQKYGPLAGALAQRLMDAGSAIGDTAEGVAKGLSGIGMAEEAGTNLAHAVDRGDPLAAAGSVAQAGLAALPAAGRFAKPLIETTPRLASLLMTAGIAPAAAAGVLSPTEAEAKSRKPVQALAVEDKPLPADNGLTPDQNARMIQLQKDVARGNWRTGAERRAKESELNQLQGLATDYAKNRNAAATEAARIEATAKAQREADAAAATQKADQEKAALDQPFQSRHPNIATGLAIGAPIASGVLAATGLGRVAMKGKGLLAELLQAREAGDVTKMAETAAALNNWQKSAPIKQAMAIGVPATLPADARVTGDIVDKYSLPNTSKAQHEAAERLGDPVQYAKDAIPAIASGLVFGGVGSKFAPSAPRGDAKAMLGLYGGKDPATLSEVLQKGADATATVQGPIGRAQRARQARESGNQQVDNGDALAQEALGGASQSSLPSELAHHSALQPRNKKGRFSGPPQRPKNDN